MGFFDEVLNLFNGEDYDSSFKIVVLGSSGAIIEGYKRIIAMEESEIIIEIKNKKQIVVSGAKLYIKKLEKEELVIAGDIMALKVI